MSREGLGPTFLDIPPIYHKSGGGGLSSLDPRHNACDPDDHSSPPDPPLSETPPESPPPADDSVPAGRIYPGTSIHSGQIEAEVIRHGGLKGIGIDDED